MRITLKRILPVIMPLMMVTSLFQVSIINTDAEETNTDISGEENQGEDTGKITDQSTWHILEDRSLSDLIHDDYIEQLRNGEVNREEEITLTLSRLDDSDAVAGYLLNSVHTEQTGKAKEGDYLRWNLPETVRVEITDHVFTGYQIYTFTPDYYTNAEEETKVDEEVNDLLDRLEIRYNTDYRKIKVIYDWMKTYISLADTSDDNHSKTAYGALVDRHADSQGFAVLFYRLMLEMGVDCRVIHGYTPDHDSWFWNIVKLGDLYYFIDIAGTLESEYVKDFFLNGAAAFVNHTPDAEYRTLQFNVAYEMAADTFVPADEDLIEEDVCQGAFFDTRTIIIDENETCKLEASVLPLTCSQGVIWFSSDTSILSVDQHGNITGNSEGTAYVTAKPEAGGKSARCKVTVEKVYPDSGTAYAVLVTTNEEYNWGDMVFLRSKNNYEPNTVTEVEDIWGNKYYGQILAKGATLEGARCNYNSTPRPWKDISFAILRIYCAENQIIHVQQMTGWFVYMDNLKEFYGNGFDLSHCQAGGLVQHCDKLEKVDLTGIETAGVRSFGSWFYWCRSLKEIDLSPLDTSTAVSMSSIFDMCTSLEKADLSSFDTSDMISMNRAFFGTKLKEIKLGPGFTKWIDETYLPAGLWTNGTIIKNETELYNEYPEHAAEWAGTWYKTENEVHVTDVILTPSELNLKVGESENLHVEIVPENASNRNIIWSSYDESVATVDQSGKVTALKEGTAVISAQSEDVDIAGLCLVTVTSNLPPIPDGISLNIYRADLAINGEIQLKAEVSPPEANQEVMWGSTNDAVATVDDNGVVRGVKPGIAIIQASAWNGIPAQCKIRVLFDDVGRSAQFFFEPVYWALENNITTGTGETTFSPDDNVTRGQIVTFLYRAAGEPEVSGSMPFTDVKQSNFFYKAVMWASENGITTGTSATTFSPNDYCTRGQIVTFLWRYANQPSAESASAFIDVKPAAFYAKAVAWAAENGITTGTSPTTFSPNNTCTRGQAVTFLFRTADLEE